MIGVLALQGDWDAHRTLLRRLGADTWLVRMPADLCGLRGLVLPGGESTTMLRLLADDGLDAALAKLLGDGLPVLATCAGVILLARDVDPPQRSLALLDVTVARNAFGRQVHSSVSEIRFDPALGEPLIGQGVFIRAPRIQRVGAAVRVLATRDAEPVAVEQGRMVAVTYHPELTGDERLHRRWLALTEARDG